MESSDRTSKSLLVIGKVGAGKSTVLNKLANEEIFESSNKPSSCTKIVASKKINFEGYPLKIFDVPGLCDPKMPISKWVENLLTGVNNQ